MTKIGIIGCGVVGAAIAYELSQVTGLEITVWEQQAAGTGATAAALGVLVGAISRKFKGRNVRMRLESIRQYDLWVPQLEAITGQPIPYNRDGLVQLCFSDADLPGWQSLIQLRQRQGWPLHLLSVEELADRYPHLCLEGVVAAVYSPCDRQIDPVAVTQALITAAQHNGVTLQLQTAVTGFDTELQGNGQQVTHVHTPKQTQAVDWLVIAAGLGSTPLTQSLQALVQIQPVLGQAVRVRSPHPLGHADHQPVITGDDIHIVPVVGTTDYWIGATVQPPPESVVNGSDWASLQPDGALLDTVIQGAIALCPALADLPIIHTWSGLRPRPVGRPAPIIEPLSGYGNVLLATGHYRNGIALAPATAQAIKAMITG